VPPVSPGGGWICSLVISKRAQSKIHGGMGEGPGLICQMGKYYFISLSSFLGYSWALAWEIL
jgi:hypothetical protein